ncbi:MAG: cupin domain-containing protein [Deltaproteobacteria bacterium]|nr:cupin domain-containing protein [Deltaproteobacteria bacterium]
MKPVINLDQLSFEPFARGPFEQRHATIGSRIGATSLGYNLTIVPPGKRACPFHNHHANEEMFLILDGSGQLRFGDEMFTLRKYDVIACPAGTRDVAHQIINTGTEDLTYLALSTTQRVEICEYPDSDKIGAYVGDHGQMDLRALFRAEGAVDYMEGEAPG